MKKFMTTCMLAMLATMINPAFGQSRKSVLAPSTTSASTTSAPSGKTSVFSSLEECRTAYASGSFTYYVPTHLGMTEKRPVDGIHTKAFALERDTLTELLVFGNKYGWVVLQAGTVCRYELMPGGQPFGTPYAHHACGNPIKSIGYPTAKLTQAAPSPVPVTVTAPAPQVSVQVPAPQVTYQQAPPTIVQAPAPQVIVQVPAPQVTVQAPPPVVIQAPQPQVTVQQQPAPMGPVYGPTRPSVLPRFYDVKPDWREPMPAVPEVKKIGWGWKLLGGAILAFAVYKALDHKKPDEHRAVITDPPTGMANQGGFQVAHW